VIADAVYFAIAGIGFCRAAGRSMMSRGFTAGVSDLMRQNWTERRGRSRVGILHADQEILKEG
jgi:hypothetical protein